MIDKEFVPYEQALALKELGFDEPCFGKYDIYGVFDHKLFYHNHDADTILNCSAPTFSQCFRWFREKHDLVHHINRDGGWWLCSILDLYDEKEQGAIETHIDNCYPDTYEEAELACLIKLIQIVKDGKVQTN